MLERVQGWMYRVIATPRGVAIAAREADEHILPSRTLSAAERVGIYNGMYLSRFVEALEVDYPALAYYLGGHEFHAVVSRYVDKYPSRSYTLNRLGDMLPDFLEGFERDLARLELAMTQVFDEEETPSADLTLLPPDRAEQMRLVPIKALRLLSLNYNSNECFQAFRDEEHMHPRRGRNFLLVHRKDYAVMRMPLTKKSHDFLRELMSGKTLVEAIESVRPSQHALFEWFRDWSAAGIFRSFGE
jgi:putative DNA-binding protein